MRYAGSRRRRLKLHALLLVCGVFTGLGLLLLTMRPVDPSTVANFPIMVQAARDVNASSQLGKKKVSKPCATVEQMGGDFSLGWWKESIRVRRIIEDHFALYGASRVRSLPPEQFCRHGFVMGKASEAGFGNEMYKILTAAALSIMLNRSLIIGQTRGKFPFGDYISYTNLTFTLKEVKHLWRHSGCMKKYGRHLVMRIDDFQKPSATNVLCSNWKDWEEPIIWFQGTTDAVGAQFFLKNIHPDMRSAASTLFGQPERIHSRPNVFGELMRVLISPSKDVEEAVNWVIGGSEDPDITLHMRMLMNRSVRAVQAALNCTKKAIDHLKQGPRRRVVLVSDTPSVINSIQTSLSAFAEVLHFDYKLFKGNLSAAELKGLHNLEFRVKDWGPAPRWVAFVDFFLASRAKWAVISGAHRRVGTTYVQLIAALAATRGVEEDFPTGSSFSFLSSFQSNLLTEGLGNQVGWGHVWNRFAGPLSCHNQSNQCASTPLLPPSWWDGIWQSPIQRDIRRLEAYGIQLSGFGTFDENHLCSFCNSRKTVVFTVPIISK